MTTKLQMNSTAIIIKFLDEIDIPVYTGEVPNDTFLPGILVNRGSLIFDEKKMKFPGDLLHEAGHLAITPSQQRAELFKDVSKDPGDELATMAWSWAALKYLEISPEIVFHPEGFNGDSEWLIEMFSSGGEMGVPVLQWMGLTMGSAKAEELGMDAFPAMQKWLRD